MCLQSRDFTPYAWCTVERSLLPQIRRAPRCCSWAIRSTVHTTRGVPRNPARQAVRGSTQHRTTCADDDVAWLALQGAASVQRRNMLLAPVVLASAWALAPHIAAAEELAAEQLANVTDSAVSLIPPATQFTYAFASDIAIDLKPEQYYSLMFNARGPVYALISQCMQDEDFGRLALAPAQPPFSDLRAAGLYSGWSLLQANDFAAAAECRKAYLAFEVHVQDLQQMAETAAAHTAVPEQAQQSFIMLNASLEQLLASIPPKYMEG